MKKILLFFLKNRMLLNIVILFIIVAGVFSIQKIQKDVFPLSDIDTMMMYINYPGASPSDIEINAVIPVERVLSTISGIKEYSSYSIDNQGVVYAYIDSDISDKKAVKDQIYRSISLGNVPDLSEDVESINIVDINPKLMSIINVAVVPKSASDFNKKSFFDFADRVEKKLLSRPGVSEIRKSGYQDREMKVSVNPAKLDSNYVSMSEIISSIQTRNIKATGGTIQSVQKEENVVTIGQFKNPAEVGDVIVRSNFANNQIKVKDLAKVTDGFKDEYVKVRVDGKPAVILSVIKKENADVLETAKDVKKFIESSGINTSDKYEIKMIDDKSKSIDALLNVVISNALIGFALVFIVLVLFFDIKTSFWTAFGIPVSLLMVMSFMHVYGLSINMISLGAIITVLGMMVDHGIVISEIVYENKNKGNDPEASVAKSVMSVISPVSVTILTTIVAFLPMLAVKGMMGKFIYIFPVIISATLIASFIEALFFLPSHLAHSKTKHKEKKWFVPLISFYKKGLNLVLNFRYAVVAVFIVLLGLSLFASRNTIKNYVLLWDDSADAVFVNFEAPVGTTLDRMEELTMEMIPIVKKQLQEDELVAINANIGHHTVKRLSSKGNREHWSQLMIYLTPKSDRKRTAAEIIKVLQNGINHKKFTQFSKIMYKERVIGPAPGEAFELKIIPGENQADGLAVMKDIMKFIKQQEGVKGMINDQEKGKNEILIQFNYNKLAAYGMDVATVSQAVKSAYDGIIATSIQTPKQRLDFRVLVDEKYKRDKAFLSKLLIPNGLGALVSLNEIASFKTSPGKSVINHFNGDRVITITASVDTEVITSSQLSKLVRSKIPEYKTNYPEIDYVMGGEAKETAESMNDLKIAFAMAIVFIYLILVLLFKSPIQPLVVLLSIPFGLTGALAAFTVHGIPLSFMGIIGIIGLSGVVVNDSVVMVDFINKLKLENTGDIKSSVIEGAVKRFRPVFLTTVTTVAGLLPTVYGIGGDAKTLVPVVMAMAYGLLYATFITLFFIPAFYLISDEIVGKVKSVFAK